MASELTPDFTPVRSQVLRDYLYSRLLNCANLSLSDKLLGLSMVSRDSTRAFDSAKSSYDPSTPPPQVIGYLTGYLLDSHGEIPGETSSSNTLPDCLSDYLRGRIAKINT